MNTFQALPILAGTALATAFATAKFATRHIKEVPLTSLASTNMLSRFTNVPFQHVDLYEAKIDHSTNVQTLARTFFQTPVFKAERVVLNAVGIGSISDEEIHAMAFQKGDNVVIFRVVETSSNEILFCWSDDKDVNGYSYLAVADDGQTLYFGSSIQTKKLLVKIFTPIHLLYAQILLASTKNSLEATARG